jgi:hypothetical protein
MEGWIKFHRELMEHPLVGFKQPYSKSEAWIWMVTQARFEDTKEYRDFGGKERLINMPRGTLTHSIRFMSKSFGWSTCKIINFLKILENDSQIAQKSIQQITQITICNYERYQGDGTQQTIRQQHSRKTATTQQKNEIKKEENEKKEKNNKIFFGEFVKLTKEEHQKLVDKYESEFVDACIERLDNYIGSNGKKYKSHYRTILSWVASAELKTGEWVK